MAIDAETAKRILEGTVTEPAEEALELRDDAVTETPGGEPANLEGVDEGEGQPGEGEGKEGGKREPHPLEEFGVRGSGDDALLGQLNERIQDLSARLEMAERELEAEKSRKAHPMAGMTEDEVNERIEELGEKGKMAEAATLLADWREFQKSKSGPQINPEKLTEGYKSELARYVRIAPENQRLLHMMIEPKIASRLAQFGGVIRGDRQGAADLIHLACLGMKAEEILQKGIKIGRASVGVSSPAGGSGSPGVKFGPKSSSAARRRETAASMFMPGKQSARRKT